MPFDPAQPAANSPLASQVMRDQFNALKALIDAVPVPPVPPATAYGKVGADWTSGSASFVDVTGLAFAVAAGESWTAEVALAVVSGTTGQGLKFRVSGPGAASVMIAMLGTGSGGTSTSIDCEVQTAFAVASPAKTFCAGSSLPGVVRVHVVVTNASAGSVQLQASNSSGSGTVTIKANSDLLARRTG